MKKTFLLLLVLAPLMGLSQSVLSPSSKIHVDTITTKMIPPGNYLERGSIKILSGYAASAAAIGMFLVASSIESNDAIMKAQYPSYKMRDVSALYLFGGLIGTAGIVLHISGFFDYKKAGISLNEYGIGIKVKF